MIIIGILAAIAIPVFLAQRDRAREAAAESDLRNVTQAMTAFSATPAANGSYTGVTAGNLTTQGFNRTDDVQVAITVNGPNDYDATARHTDGGQEFSFTTGPGVFQGANPGNVSPSNPQPAALPAGAVGSLTVTP